MDGTRKQMSYDVVLLTCLSDSIWQRAIGPYQLASHLRQHDISVQIIDFTDHFSTEELIHYINKFVGKDTKIIGVSSTFYQQSSAEKEKSWVLGETGILPSNIRSLLSHIKETYPHIKLAIGGGNSCYFENDQTFDIVVHGYAEEVFLKYLKGKKNLYPKIGSTEIINGDVEKFDVEHLRHSWAQNDLILPNETLPIEISRGCIFKCKFCNYPLNGKKKFDYLRSADLIADELVENYEKYGTTNYLFADDTFNDSTHKLEQLHKKITQLPFKVNFTTYLRLDLLNAHREQLPLLKELGLKSAFFGIETLNDKSAKFIGKGMPSSKVKDFLLELKNDIWKDDISMLCTFIVGLPFENIESTDQSFEWVKSAGLDSAWGPLWINVNHRYRSDLSLNYEKYGYKIVDAEKGTWVNDIMSHEDADQAANRYNSYVFKENHLVSWILLSLASYNLHTLDELQKTKNKDFPRDLYKKRQAEMVLEYKKMLDNLK
jgi:radical SAM superfamily enzyme YgiQ (UPF0313 family)